jgi:bleomycin hydrolase
MAQVTNKPGSQYQFKEIHSIDKTAVRDQCQTGTCWSYSTLSFFESELIKMGKGNHDLSEMFVARNAYIEKAITFVRMGGKHQFDEGGEGHDIPFIIEKYGIVPESVYTGLVNGKTRHNHSQLMSVLKPVVEAIAKEKPGQIGPEWIEAVEGILDAYLGKIPESFEYQGKTYTPLTFAKSLGLNMNDYAMLTSFTHHPYYQTFAIEVPDNWSMQTAWNLPLDELMATVNESLEKGHSVAWATDVSEKGFSFRDALAIVPQHDSLIKKVGKDDRLFNSAGAEKKGDAFNKPVVEKTIDSKVRQDAFDNQSTTDDHGMHIVAQYLEETSQTPYYLVKNSWGINNPANGYLYASENYLKYKTISILVNKNGVPKNIRKKMGW